MEIKINKTLIIFIYNYTSSTRNESNNELQGEILSLAVKKITERSKIRGLNTIIMGDLNIDYKANSSHTGKGRQLLERIIKSNLVKDLLPHNINTWKRGNRESRIDYILTTNINILNGFGLTEIGDTDHLGVMAYLKNSNHQLQAFQKLFLTPNYCCQLDLKYI